MELHKIRIPLYRILKIKKYKNMDELIQGCPEHSIIGENLMRAWVKINNPVYERIVCAVSGGSDSDIQLDIVWKCDINNKVDYVWFDTGLEYQATKDHLKKLEEKYEIKIKSYKPTKPIPTACKKYGQPFVSKNVSEMIDRLQRYDFQWEDEPLEVLLEKYCVWNEKNRIGLGVKVL